MLSIYKKELRVYFVTATGYVFTAFMLLSAGIYVSLLNFVYYSPAFEYVIKNMCFVLLIAVPLLTMRVFADEKKQRTEQLLYILPVDMKSIVLGKFFALCTVSFIPCLIMCAYPLILSMYGAVNLKVAFGCIFAFFILQCALSAIGMFTSSLTENQIIAAILCFAILLVAYLIPSVAENISAASNFTYRAFAAIAILLAIVVFLVSKRIILSVILAAVILIPLSVIYIKFNSLLVGKFSAFAQCFAIFDRINPFTNGVFDITALIYMATAAFVFICLTIQSENRRRWR